MTTQIDQIRMVPEIASRLFLGAETVRENGSYIVRLDGREYTIDPDTYNYAEGVTRALKVRDRRVEYASDVLDLRHDAEDIFLEELFVDKDSLKILFVPAGEGASSFYRSRLPADLISKSGRSVLSHHTERLDINKALRYDVLWVQLAAVPILLQIVEQVKKAGVKIIYDIDDRWDKIPIWNAASQFYHEEQVKNVDRMIQMADLVTVSTEPLREHVLSKGAKRALTLFNSIPSHFYPTHAMPRQDIFRILWAGSPNHKMDLEVAAPGLREVLKEGNGKVRFTCFGENVPDALEDVQDFVDTIRFVDFANYPEALGDVGANLAIAPLEESLFNASKSAIKFLEYSICGYPSLYSPVGEYQYLKDIGAPIRLVTDGGWGSALREAIKDREGVKEWAKESQDWVKSNRCIASTHAQEYYDAALSVVEKGEKKE